jgi:hypothetical protein
MGLSTGNQGLTEYVTLKIKMEYAPGEKIGYGSAQWTTINPHPVFSESKAKIAISALNYGRALAIQEITRKKLFYYVDEIATSLIRTGSANFFDWPYRILFFTYNIWPWTINSYYNGGGQNIYTVTMGVNRDGMTGIILNMTSGREKVLIPSAALIPLYILANSLELEERKTLGHVLSAMNRYYEIPEGASGNTRDMRAFEFASQFLK